jgi:hypothetical protein
MTAEERTTTSRQAPVANRFSKPYPTTRRNSFGLDADFDQFDQSDWKAYELDESSQKRKVYASYNYPSLRLPTYIYKPLDSAKHLRLLKIHGHGADSTLTLTLESYRIDAAPTYTALSYTWGNPTVDSTYSGTVGPEIKCDDGTIRITENLFSALARIAEDSNHVPYLWVDALSIDQSNPHEITAQVQLMSQIYSSASKVLVWLGEAEGDTIPFITACKALNKSLSQLFSSKDVPVTHPLDENLLLQLGISQEKWRQYWTAYFGFYKKRRWFRRAWIVQEVALARELVILCGPYTIPWEEIYQLGSLVRATGWRHLLAASFSPTDKREQSGGLGDELDRLMEYRSQTKEGGPEDQYMQQTFQLVDGSHNMEQRYFSYFQYCVQEIRRYQGSDLKDKIYSVLGMVDMFLPPGVINPITPDYSYSLKKIYTATARAFIQDLPLLSNLSYVEDAKRRTVVDLPSWVPDFSIPLGRVPFNRLGTYDIFNAASIEKWPKGEMVHLDETSLLQLKGIRVTEVVEMSPPLDQLDRDRYLYPFLEVCLKLPVCYQSTGQHRLEAFWRTMIADIPEIAPVIYPAPQEYGNNFHDWTLTILQKYYSLLEIRRQYLDDHLELIKELVGAKGFQCMPEESVLSEIALLKRPVDTGVRSSNGHYLFDRAVKKTKPDRLIFRTADGHIGLGSRSMKHGDQVWLLEGARVPFVLREVNHSYGQMIYQIVGEAYVHGAMHGEWINDVFSGNPFAAVTLC